MNSPTSVRDEHSENENNLITPTKTKKSRRFSLKIAKSASKVKNFFMESPFSKSKSPLSVNNETPKESPSSPSSSSAKKRKMSWRKLRNSVRNSLRKTFSFGVRMIHEEDEDLHRVFGMEIEQLMIRERIVGISTASTGIPSFILKCLKFLFPKYSNEEGIFRISGNTEEIMNYKTKIDSGVDVSFEGETNCHNISGLLKLYFRELPQPIIPLDIQEELFSSLTYEDEDQCLKSLYSAIGNLPYTNFTVLKCIMELLQNLSLNHEHTKMTSSNLGTVWSPNLIWNKDKENDPQNLLKFSNERNEVIKRIIENADILFVERELNLDIDTLRKKKRKSVISYFEDNTSIKEDEIEENNITESDIEQEGRKVLEELSNFPLKLRKRSKRMSRKY